MHTRSTFIHDLARSISLRWAHLTAAATFFIVAFCAVSPLCASNGVTFTTPVNISSDGLGNFPQALVDSSGNIDIVYADVNFAGSCPATPVDFDCATGGIKFLRSTNGGKTFSQPVALAQTGAGPFNMALESDCTIDIAYFAKGDVFFAQSADCGQAFTPTNVTNTGTVPPENAIQMVVNQGVAEIAWRTGGNGNFVLYYAQGNSKTGFTAPIVLATDNGVVGLVGMAVSNKTTDLVWWQGEFHYTIRFLNFINGMQPVDVAATQELDGGPSFSLDPAGNMNLTWSDMDLPFNGINSAHVIQFARSAGQTGTFGSPRTVACCGVPRIATDPQGNIGLVWGWAQFIRSTDGGATFSTPLNVTAGASGGPDSDVPAQLVLPNTSFAGIAWGQGSDLWFSSSSDSGATFSSPINVTKNQSAPAALQMITDSGGDVLLFWSGNDANGHDVFFARGAPNDFTISAAPGAQSELPGGAAKFALTLTATGGFSDAVALSCTNLPPGAACAFDSSSVTPKSSGSQVTLTVTTPPTLAQGNDKFTVSAASGSITHTQDVQVSVGGITGSISPASATIAAGSSANLQVAMSSTGGFAGPVTLVCSGAPSGMNCGFVPPQTTLAANGSATSTLTVQVASKPAGSVIPHAPRNFPGPLSRNLQLTTMGIAMFVATLFMLAIPKKIFRVLRVDGDWARGFAMAALIVFIAVGLLSCGGATTPSSTSGGGTGAASGGGTGGTGGTGGGTGGSTSVTTQFMVQAQSGGATVNVGTVSITVP